MALTRLSDVIVPEVFYPYMIKKTAEGSAIFQSGILRSDSNLAGLLSGGGKSANLPFWNDLSQTESLIGSDDPALLLTPGKIGASKDVAFRQVRSQGWSSATLSGLLGGSDPMKAIGSLVGDYWAREMNANLVATLHGVYLSNVANNAGDMKVDVGTDAVGVPTAAELISADVILDTKQTMGDAAEKLSTIIMHSVVYTRLQKQNLIDFIPDSEGRVRFPTYLGYRVVVSDTAKRITGVNRTKYVTYLLGTDAIAFNEAPIPGSPMVEVDREPAQGNGVGVDMLYTRRQFVMHPYGIKFTDTTTAGEFATNTELALAVNWSRVFPERKQIPIAFLLTNG